MLTSYFDGLDFSTGKTILQPHSESAGKFRLKELSVLTYGKIILQAHSESAGNSQLRNVIY